MGSDKRLKQIDDAQISKEYETQVPLTQVCLPLNNKVLFAATETGSVRSYKYPFTGEYQ